MNGNPQNTPIIHPETLKIQPDKDKEKPRVKISTRIKGFLKKTGTWVKTHRREILVSAETILGLALIYYLNRRNKLEQQANKDGDSNLHKLIHEISRNPKLTDTQIRALKKALLAGEIPETLVKELNHNKNMVAYLSFLVGKFRVSGIRGLRARPTTRQLKYAVRMIAKEAQANPEFRKHLVQNGVEAIHGYVNPVHIHGGDGGTAQA